MNIPKSLTPSPVVEATVEIRFQSKFPPDAVIGIVYGIYGNLELEGLPILQIPAEIRKQDPNLKYKPTHKFMLGAYTVQIGGDVILLSSPIDYPGWDIYKSVLKELLEKLKSINLIQQIDYISLRYLSFFKDCNIFDHIKMNISFNQRKINYLGSALKTEIQDESYINVLQIVNNIHLKNYKTDSDGSLIDIVCVVPKDSLQIEKIGTIIDTAHSKEKNLFFSLVDEEYLQQFNPQY